MWPVLITKEISGSRFLVGGVGTQIITASTSLIRDPVEVRGGGEFAGVVAADFGGAGIGGAGVGDRAGG